MSIKSIIEEIDKKEVNESIRTDSPQGFGYITVTRGGGQDSLDINMTFQDSFRQGLIRTGIDVDEVMKELLAKMEQVYIEGIEDELGEDIR